MGNPRDWGAYRSFRRDNTLDFGVIYQDAMLKPPPPRLLDPVKQTQSYAERDRTASATC